MVSLDIVERLGDGLRGRRRLLPSLKRHHLSDKRRGRTSIHTTSSTDDTASPRTRELNHLSFKDHISLTGPHTDRRLLAQTTLRNVLGTKNLSEILSDRENISHFMQVANSVILRHNHRKSFVDVITTFCSRLTIIRYYINGDRETSA